MRQVLTTQTDSNRDGFFIYDSDVYLCVIGNFWTYRYDYDTEIFHPKLFINFPFKLFF